MFEQITIKIWRSTLPNLRMIYALTGENMSSIINRLVAKELKKITKGKNK